jgi:hypothetical protein
MQPTWACARMSASHASSQSTEPAQQPRPQWPLNRRAAAIRWPRPWRWPLDASGAANGNSAVQLQYLLHGCTAHRALARWTDKEQMCTAPAVATMPTVHQHTGSSCIIADCTKAIFRVTAACAAGWHGSLLCRLYARAVGGMCIHMCGHTMGSRSSSVSGGADCHHSVSAATACNGRGSNGDYYSAICHT